MHFFQCGCMLAVCGGTANMKEQMAQQLKLPVGYMWIKMFCVSVLTLLCVFVFFHAGGRCTNGTAALWYRTQFAVVYPDQPRSVEMVWKQEASALSFGEPNILFFTHVAGCDTSGPSLNLLSFHSPCLMRPKRPFRATPPTSKWWKHNRLRQFVRRE